ncbi:Uncharacterised protein [Serratia marcescens]|nr:Uncharacterised protein [Serratia marcescens]
MCGTRGAGRSCQRYRLKQRAKPLMRRSHSTLPRFTNSRVPSRHVLRDARQNQRISGLSRAQNCEISERAITVLHHRTCKRRVSDDYRRSGTHRIKRAGCRRCRCPNAAVVERRHNARADIEKCGRRLIIDVRSFNGTDRAAGAAGTRIRAIACSVAICLVLCRCFLNTAICHRQITNHRTQREANRVSRISVFTHTTDNV